MPAFAGLAALVWAARSGRRRAWVAAGAVSCAAVFYSLEYGVFLVTAGVLTTVTLGLFERRWKIVAKTTPAFLGGRPGGSPVPLVARAARRGEAISCASFLELPHTISDVWGLPVASAIPIARDGSVTLPANELMADGVDSCAIIVQEDRSDGSSRDRRRCVARRVEAGSPRFDRLQQRLHIGKHSFEQFSRRQPPSDAFRPAGSAPGSLPLHQGRRIEFLLDWAARSE